MVLITYLLHIDSNNIKKITSFKYFPIVFSSKNKINFEVKVSQFSNVIVILKV